MSIYRLPRFLLPLPRSLSTSQPESKSESESEARIESAVTILLHHRSKTRLNHLQSSLIGSPSSSFSPPESAQIILRLRQRPLLALRFFQSPLSSRDLLVSSTLIHVLARSRLKPQALSLLRSTIRSLPPTLSLFRSLSSLYHSCASAPFVFDLLVLSYLRLNNLPLALDIARRLPNLSTSTATALIKSASSADSALAIYNELFLGDSKPSSSSSSSSSPNAATFNALLLAFYREGRLDMINVLIREMRKRNCAENAFTYCVLMAAYCDEGMIEEAARVWSDMARSGTLPDLMAYNTMIRGYCEAGEMEKAEELVKEMGMRGVEPSCATFECLVRGYCGVKNVDMAMVLWRDARRKGFEVESSVVEEMVEGLCRRGKVDEGLRVLREEMRRRVGFEVTRRCYEVLIAGFCEGREMEMEMAVELQAEMAGRGFEVNKKVYGDFIAGYRRLGDEEKATRLEEEMLEMC